MTTLKVYLDKTRHIRGTERMLFIITPHKAVGSQTIGRWIQLTLSESGNSGIRTDKFTAHSTCSSCSAASKMGVPIERIMKAAGWCRSSTFAQYYDKPTEDTCIL